MGFSFRINQKLNDDGELVSTIFTLDEEVKENDGAIFQEELFIPFQMLEWIF